MCGLFALRADFSVPKSVLGKSPGFVCNQQNAGQKLTRRELRVSIHHQLNSSRLLRR